MSDTCAQWLALGFRNCAELLTPTPNTRLKNAALDLHRHAGVLQSISESVPTKKHGIALDWILDWRAYLFERNVSRWPDARFHLVDRDYQYWRGHRISFTGEELIALGLEEWNRRAIRDALAGSCFPLAADCFQYRPRRNLARYAALIGRIAEAFREAHFPERPT